METNSTGTERERNCSGRKSDCRRTMAGEEEVFSYTVCKRSLPVRR